MPSPFPGMNPYLEKTELWNDFHNRFVAALAGALTRPLAPRYYTRIEQYLYIHDITAEERQYLGRPDVGILPAAGSDDPAPGGAVAVAAPSTIGLPPTVDVERIPYLEIRDRDTHRVVTVIELLSPSNKYSGPDRDQYLEKQTRLLRSSANFVEIDLLRGGPRLPWDRLPKCDYYVAVSRASDRSKADCWPVNLRDPLPEVPVPLRDGEPEPLVSLQAILHRVYDEAGYDLHVYAAPPEPPLSAADAKWADGIVAAVTAPR